MALRTMKGGANFSSTQSQFVAFAFSPVAFVGIRDLLEMPCHFSKFEG